MTQVCIHTDAGSMRRSRSGQITGRLALQIGDTFYPDHQWNDFVVIVLDWWLTQIQDALAERGSLLLRFMDGPYAAELSRSSKHAFSVDLRHDDAKVRLDADVNESALAQAILVAASDALAVCQARGWVSSDIDALQESFSSVQRICARHAPRDVL